MSGKEIYVERRIYERAADLAGKGGLTYWRHLLRNYDNERRLGEASIRYYSNFVGFLFSLFLRTPCKNGRKKEKN
jgi:hypothetical protein